MRLERPASRHWVLYNIRWERDLKGIDSANENMEVETQNSLTVPLPAFRVSKTINV